MAVAGGGSPQEDRPVRKTSSSKSRLLNGQGLQPQPAFEKVTPLLPEQTLLSPSL